MKQAYINRTEEVTVKKKKKKKKNMFKCVLLYTKGVLDNYMSSIFLRPTNMGPVTNLFDSVVQWSTIWYHTMRKALDKMFGFNLKKRNFYFSFLLLTKDNITLENVMQEKHEISSKLFFWWFTHCSSTFLVWKILNKHFSID